ncbi:MAG: ABC transporter permease [Gemmatimonadaceae bacterium]|nr:ABC transporter permease [Gemmatimonadaceae bacterium]
MEPPLNLPSTLLRARTSESSGQRRNDAGSDRWSQLLDDIVGDLRYAARTLRLAPGFTFAAVLSLAIGIGANTAIFSAVDGILLKPLPFRQPDRLVALFQDNRKSDVDHDDVAPGNFTDWRERSRAFTGLAAAEPFALNYSSVDGEEQIYNWNVTQDFFVVLNARPLLGRLLQAADFIPNGERVVVLTYGSWRRRFGADPNIVGKHLTIGGGPVSIIGVLPRDFAYLESSKMEMYVPKVLDSAEVHLRNPAWWHVVGRLRPGATIEGARGDMNRVAAQLSTEYPATNAEVGVRVDRLDDTIVGDSARALFLLLGAVGMVLLIACANVANLMLTRTARRSREFAMRAALGASGGRVVRQVLTESLLVAVSGGLVGAGLASWAVSMMRALGPASLPRLSEMRVDGRALAFTLAAVVVATFLFGLIPALRAAHPNATDELKSGGRTAGSELQHRLRALIVAAEVALAMVLLVGGGLLLRSFISVVRADRGYRSDHVLAATVFVYDWNKTPGARREFIARLVERARVIPGVVAAGATSSLPLDMAIEADKGSFTIVGQSVAAGEAPAAHMTALTPGAFDALRIPLRRGRLFSPRDDSSSVPVAIISEAMAARYWPNENSLGKRVRLKFYGPLSEREIVGVVADVRQVALDAPVEPTLYVPHAQAPTGGVVLVLRTSMEPERLQRSVKRIIAELNPALPIAGMETLDELASTSITPRRFTLTVFACFSLTALALAVLGVYGVISQGVAERRKEIGVRIALGAQQRDIVRMVMSQGFTFAGIGIAVGVAGAVALTGLLRGMLFGVVPLDAPTFGVVGMLLLGTAMLACYFPARQATCIDPMIALRAD